MAKVKIFVQTVLNILALNLILVPIIEPFMPDGAISVFVVFFYWAMLLIASYTLSIFLIESK